MSLLQTVARRTSGLVGRESRFIRRLRPAYESLLEWSGRGRGAAWAINGVVYRVDPHCRHRLGQNYDAPVARFLRERVRPGALCIDVGANVGVYVLQFAHWSGPTGQVVAFEPNPTARAILEKHVRMNALTERVRVVNAAVGATSGEAILYAAEADGMSRLGAPNKELAGNFYEVAVSVMTLDDYCAAERLKPDWLLIDIEGFEMAALAGARELINNCRGELGIIVEMHPSVWDSANTTRAGAEALLADLNLRAVPLMGQADALGEHGLVHLAYQ
ncbi:MAG TPA: FkbM family methyltransferase [Pyrinomonadaceae bacterium]